LLQRNVLRALALPVTALPAIALATACIALSVSKTASALEIGFESSLLVIASDNVDALGDGLEEEGQIGTATFGVFGSQDGTKLRAAFAGQIRSSKQLDDEDDDFTSVTQFVGAAEFKITPRSFTWYFGNTLGTVLPDDGVEPIDLIGSERRDVFITGPEFQYNFGAFSRASARLLYVNQTQNDVTLETVYNGNADIEYDTTGGSTIGLGFTNTFTDNPETNPDGDFNRMSLSALWRRERARNSYEFSLGGTRYDVDERSLNGINGQASFRRQLTLNSSFSFVLTRDLRNESLNTVESILVDGVGRDSGGNGVFDLTSGTLSYGFTTANSNIALSAGAGQSEFRLLTNDEGVTFSSEEEDRRNAFASASFMRQLSALTRFQTSLRYSTQDFVNTPEETQSLLGTASISRVIGRSFSVSLEYSTSVTGGKRTTTDGLEDIDTMQNRVTFGLVWAPPTRANKDLTVQVQSLLQ